MLHPIDVIRKILLGLIVIVLLLVSIGYGCTQNHLFFYAELIFYVIVIIASLPLLLFVLTSKNKS